MKKLNDKQKESKLSAKESGMYDDMRLVLEFYERGFEFMPIDVYKAKARHFTLLYRSIQLNGLCI
jgi:DNA polymerase-3 subunit alpha (Gram-positive type)